MYINGRKITLDDLQALTNNLIGSLINDLYNEIKKSGIKDSIPGDTKKQLSILNKMIEHYIEREEYEKCAFLRDQIILHALQN
tara:strand:+ start:1277 stop:1525 length:249 start_codon:yes stop_codon:yes gene_type:complete